MRQILIWMLLICGLNMSAQYTWKDQINDIREINERLQHEIDTLQKCIKEKEEKLARIDGRKPDRPDIYKIMESYPGFTAIYSDREKLRKTLEDVDENDEDYYPISYAYLEAIKMMESLERAYNAEGNNNFKNEIEYVRSNILPIHDGDFGKIAERIKDYRLYMYELDRLFEAARNDNFKTSSEELANQEYASYLVYDLFGIKLFTREMLDKYITNQGNLDRNDKVMLHSMGLEDAFKNL